MQINGFSFYVFFSLIIWLTTNNQNNHNNNNINININININKINHI